MERSIKTIQEEAKTGENRHKENPVKTRWQRFKERAAEGIMVLGIAAAVAIPCGVAASCSKAPNTEKDASADLDADTDSDVDTDTDTDTDTDADSDSDTDTDSDSDTETETDSGTEMDSGTEEDGGPDAGDTDTETDSGPTSGFAIDGSEIRIAKERVMGTLPISLEPGDFLYDPEGYSISLTMIKGWMADDPASIAVQDPPFADSSLIDIEQGQTKSASFSSPPAAKYAHLYTTNAASDEATIAFVEAPFVLAHGSTVDLGNGVHGTVSIGWENESMPNPGDPQYVSSIRIGATEGVWGTGTPITPGKGVPVCLENEEWGVTGVEFSLCGRAGIIPASRIFIEFGGELFVVTKVTPQGGVY